MAEQLEHVKDEYRIVLGQFATGVTVVTTKLGDRIHGMTANAFSSVSLDPPLVLVCIGKPNRTHDLMLESKIFAFSVLSEDQKDLSEHFARRAEQDRFEGISWRTHITGAPILNNSIGYIDCRLWTTYDGGDHTIFVGEVLAAEHFVEEGHPLLFFAGKYRVLNEA